MEHCLFISDCHLCDSRPQITQAFNAFLANIAVQAQALYILGDLFEYWAGDDAIAAGQHPSVIQALKNLSASGVKVFFMSGNRDFLVCDGFEQATGATILPDPTVVKLFGKRVLLSHGDALCTDDVAYQQFRTEVRSATWQARFLSQPLSKRVAYIEELRNKSEQAKSTKSMQIMDVNAAAVDAILQEFAYPPIFIHGHTHRPQKHSHRLDGNNCERWVLGDWYEQGSYLSLSAAGCVAHQLHA